MTDNPNSALIKTLKTYIEDNRAADYALMLTGEWGIGKTYLIRQIIKENIGVKKPIYVSLFGVSSKQDFDDVVIASIYPIVDKKLVKLTAAAAKTLGGIFRFKTDIKLSDIISTVRSGYFIFDDLERIASTITTQEVLGFINRYVEHGECRVVIIGNEDEIKNPDEYKKTKEKIIGRTLRVKANSKDAMTAYLDAIEQAEFKIFANENRSIFERAYNQSKVNNLRVLKQALWDVEHFYRILKPEHHKFSSEVISIIRLLFVFALEAKKGNITSDDVSNRLHGLSAAARKKNKDHEPSNIEILQEKHADIYAYDTSLNNGCLKGIIFDGAFSEKEIFTSLDESNKFKVPADEVEWKTVWYATQRESKHVKEAANEMERKYAAGEYVIPGIILHVFTQRLWLAEIGFINDDEAMIVQSAKKYIDRLFEKGSLESRYNARYYETKHDAYENLQFSKKDEKPFQDVAKYLSEKQLEAYNQKLTEDAPLLLEWLKNDIDRYVANLLPFRGSDSTYGHVSILQHLDPKKFISTLLGSSAANQNEAVILFCNRYKNALLYGDLANEREWFDKMRKILKAEISKQELFDKDRLERLYRWYLEDIETAPPKIAVKT